MLGWDALTSGSGTLPLFNFGQLDAEEMRRDLLTSMPKELYALAEENPISVETMRHLFANSTAARFSDLDATILDLAQAKEFTILNALGKERKSKPRRLQSTDRIAVPTQRTFSGFLVPES